LLLRFVTGGGKRLPPAPEAGLVTAQGRQIAMVSIEEALVTTVGNDFFLTILYAGE
jgi:hypothetical protein